MGSLETTSTRAPCSDAAWAAALPAPPEPTLADKVETLCSNLGLDRAAGVPQVLDKACEALGLDEAYPNLGAKADACLEAAGVTAIAGASRATT